MDLKPPYSPKVWKIIAGCAAGVVLIGVVLLAVDKISNWNTNRDFNNRKQKIANTVTEINDLKAKQANLAEQEAEKRGELKRDVEDLANQTYGREDIKRETNAALANYNKAVQSNSNVDATAEDLQRALDKLANTQ